MTTRPKPARALSARVSRHFVAFAVACLAFAPAARAATTTLTFSDQTFNDAMDPSVYELAGFGGTTATFSGWTAWDFALGGDRSASSDEISLYSDGANASITFSPAVEVPVFYISAPSFPPASGNDVITGMLGSTVQFTATNNTTAHNWIAVSDGAGKLIDTLLFTNYADSELDDVTISSPAPLPEPSAALLCALGLAWRCTRRSPARTANSVSRRHGRAIG